MVFYYSDTFDIPLPEKHRFPGGKYSVLRSELISSEILKEDQLRESPLADIEDVLRVHEPNYVERFLKGTLERKEMTRIGFPWSEFLVKRILATMGGAVSSARSALEHGISGQLAGGTHHAHYDFGSGYCIFNDFAIAAKKLLLDPKIDRVGIIDLDVHQGDGNASLLKSDPQVFVASVHGEKNFPFRKHESDLDIALVDQCGDKKYLEACEKALFSVLSFRPDIVLFQAGVDALEFDKLGRLGVSLEALKFRDSLVLSECRKRAIPVSMAIGGGYSEPISHSVRAYVQTYQVAKGIYKF